MPPINSLLTPKTNFYSKSNLFVNKWYIPS